MLRTSLDLLNPRTALLAVVLLCLAGTGHAQSRSAASQFNGTTINDQINLQVLNAITKSVYASYTSGCLDSYGTNHPNGTSWNTACPLPYAPSSGAMTYTCISGYVALQNNTCH